MKTLHTVTGKSKIAEIQALFLCCLLLFFSCTKEKERTEHDYPRVTTGSVTNINAGGATFNGSFLHSGNSEIIDHGFVFETTAFPNIQTGENISLGTSIGKGSFTATVNFGMISEQTYHVSAYARSRNNIFYAESVSFVSKGCMSPEIIAIVPSEGMRGDTVVIKGKYFSQLPRNNAVKFGDEDVAILTASDTALILQIPASNNKEHVDVFVTTFGQTVQKINGFRYLKPVIKDFSPGQGMIGDTVIIRGQYFDKVKEHNIVKFRNNQASIINASDTVLTMKVPSSDGEEYVDVFVTASGVTTQKAGGFQYLKPVITDFSPRQSVIGDTITITGQNFRPNVEIMFNQVIASVDQSDQTSAKVIVPACQSISAKISATIDGLTSIAEQPFIYAKPEITGLSENKGVIGDMIVIYGKNFGYQKNVVTVFFGEQPVTVSDVNNLSIVLIVPASNGRTSLPVTVRVDGQLAEGNQIFSYLAPVIESFEPQNACGGDTVVIRGQYFLTTNQLNVSFGTYNVDKFDKITDTEIQAVAPFSKGVEEVSISVRNNGLTTVSENKFRYLKPEITDISPNKGVKNDQITITGMNFGKYNSNLSVHFDNNEAAVLEHSPNKLVVTVPKFQGNKTSEIKVTRDGLAGIFEQKFQYIEPVITGFSPSSGRVGNTITINGQYFSNYISDVQVYCGDFQLAIVSCSDNQIVVTIPNTVASTIRPIRVSVDGNEGASAESFEIISPWTKKAALPNGGRLSPITATYNDEGYIAFGRPNEWSSFTDCWKYNPDEDTWQMVTSNLGNYSQNSTFFQINDLWFWGSGNNFYQVSLETFQRKGITNLPQNGMTGTFSFIIDNKSYVCGGGWANNMYVSFMWQYDPVTDEWTKKAPMPGTGRTFGIAFSHNKKGYAGLGGRGVERLKDLYEYDQQNDRWIRKTDFPGTAVTDAIGFTVNNRVFAGLGTTGSISMRDIWEYDPVSDSWSHVAIIPNYGGDGAYVFVINNKAYIGGGNMYGIVNQEFYEFDPSKLQ